MSDQRWRRFEKLVAKIQAELSPGATVVHDEKIPGKKSGTDRQIDISVRQSIGQFNLLIVIDCKDYKGPVDIGEVGQFIDMVNDVGANKGAMVSASGFSKAAQRRASEAGIDLFRLVDAESEDWRAYVRAGFFWHILVLRDAAFSIAPGWNFLARSDDPSSEQIYDGKGNSLGTPLQLVKQRWNAGLLREEPGVHGGLPLHQESIFFRHEGKFYAARIEAEITVEDELYFGYVPLGQIRGLQNVVTGGIITRGFKTQLISVDEIRSTWRRVENRDDLAVQAVLEVQSVLLIPDMKDTE